MSKSNFGHPGNEESVTDKIHAGPPDQVYRGPVPYWKRAHRDWVFWLGLFLMLSAAMIYVLSDDLALLPSGRPVHAPANAVER